MKFSFGKQKSVIYDNYLRGKTGMSLKGLDSISALLGRTGRYLDKANRQDLRTRLYAEVKSLNSYDEALSFMVKLLEEAGYDVA
jgi:hypothetical protein